MKLSIAICTRNHAPVLARTLQRLAQLPLREQGSSELLVVDNGSRDETHSIVKNLRIDLPVRYLREDRPGVAWARNLALEAFRGDCLAFIDDDIIVSEDWACEIVKPLEQGMFSAAQGYIRFPDHIRNSGLSEEFYPSYAYVDDFLFENGNPKWIATANFCIARSAVDRGIRFDTELGPGALGFAEDALFCMQLLESGEQIAPAPKAWVEHWFDVERIFPKSVYKMAAQMGRSNAYVDYHWRHSPARFKRRLLKLAFKKAVQTLSRPWTPKAEMSLSMDEFMLRYYVNYLIQLREEKNRLPNYERLGKEKIRSLS